MNKHKAFKHEVFRPRYDEIKNYLSPKLTVTSEKKMKDTVHNSRLVMKISISEGETGRKHSAYCRYILEQQTKISLIVFYTDTLPLFKIPRTNYQNKLLSQFLKLRNIKVLRNVIIIHFFFLYSTMSFTVATKLLSYCFMLSTVHLM